MIKRRRGGWERLRELSAKRTLTGPETDELLTQYAQTSTDLSQVRSESPDASTVSHLSVLLSNARMSMVATSGRGFAAAGHFFAASFPAALYRMRRWWITVTLLNMGLALALGTWLVYNPVLENTLISTAEIQQLVNGSFESYYSENPPVSFGSLVFINNAWVAAQCIIFGVFGFPVVWVLWQNVANVAIVGSLMHANDRGALFWGLIAPHGLLELTAIFVAGGVGLRLFWSWVEPGARSRLASFSAEGRSAIGIVLGLIPVFLISGIIEAFVTPSGLPTWARVSIGVAALLLFLTYIFTLGRRAHLAGVTGDLERAALGDELAVVD